MASLFVGEVGIDLVGQQVLVEIAVGVAVIHRNVAEQVDHSCGVGMVNRASFMCSP